MNYYRLMIFHNFTITTSIMIFTTTRSIITTSSSKITTCQPKITTELLLNNSVVDKKARYRVAKLFFVNLHEFKHLNNAKSCRKYIFGSFCIKCKSLVIQTQIFTCFKFVQELRMQIRNKIACRKRDKYKVTSHFALVSNSLWYSAVVLLPKLLGKPCRNSIEVAQSLHYSYKIDVPRT